MSMLEKLAVSLALTLGVSVAGAADAPRLGQPIAPNDLASWDISIAPDGSGLPLGSGTPSQGAAVFAMLAAFPSENSMVTRSCSGPGQRPPFGSHTCFPLPRSRVECEQ